MKHILCLVLSIVFFSRSHAQHQLASPQIIHYSTTEYKAGMQNWDVAQDQQGIMYFGNNEGLLTFNGRFWNTYPLANHTAVRSLKIDTQNRIYVGGLGEIGYFFPNANGVLTYHSLMPLLHSKDRNFSDVWHICIRGEEVFFQSLRQIMRLYRGKITVYKSTRAWSFLGMAQEQLYAQDREKGLFRYERGTWVLQSSEEPLQKLGVTSLRSYGRDTLLVTTLERGVFLLHGPKIERKATALDAIFNSDRIYCSAQVGQETYAFGTTSAGLYLMNRAGKALQKYTSAEGLQNSNVRAIWLDRNQNLWLALDDGIDFIAINSPIQYLYPSGNKHTTGYALYKQGRTLYAGTSNGLFRATLEGSTQDLSRAQGTFTEIPAAKGQVWRLGELRGKLYMGHENGFFQIEQDQVKPVYHFPGTWLWVPFSGTDYLVGTYDGLRHLRYENGSVNGIQDLKGLKESLRFVYADSVRRTIWASHPSRGVFRMQWSPAQTALQQIRLYTQQHGLPSSLYNYVYAVKNRLVVSTERGIYEFNEAQSRFVPSSLFQPILGNLAVQYLKEDAQGNIWFVSHKRLGVIDFQPRNGQKFRIVYFPELTDKLVGGFESLYPVDPQNIFVGSHKGFIHINYEQYRTQVSKPLILLSEIKASGDSVVFGGYFVEQGKVKATQDSQQRLQLSAGMNSLHFAYASPLEYETNTTEYSYRLQGETEEWSAWSTKSEKDYTNLPWGAYTFQVKARNNQGNESAILSYQLYIEPAWYESYWSYLVYALLAAGLVYYLFHWQKRKHRSEQKQLTYLHQLELDRAEKELVRLQNEQLEADVDFKNRELAAMTMQLVQRGEVLVKVKEVVSTLAKKQDTKDSAVSFRQVLRLIRDVESKDADWGQFTLHFNTVHDDFFHLLKDRYPELTPNDLKLCAYLKMNLSSKEIARLMNVTVKAIEIGRYRLRKKLLLSTEVNLYEFLVDLAKESK